MRKYQLWRVEWVDAMTRSGWQDPEADFSSVPSVTVGFLIARKRGYVVMAQTIGLDSDAAPFSTTTTIPRGCITKMERIP